MKKYINRSTIFFLIISFVLQTFSFAQGAWTPKTNFGGTARSGAVGFSIGTKGYIGTGGNGPVYNDFWEWDIATNVWAQKANFGGTARSGANGFSIGNKGYIGMGYSGGYKQDFWEWDQASNIWNQKANFGGVAREAAVGFSIGTKGYIGLGFGGGYILDFWEWEQATNVWTQKANFGGTGREQAVGFSIGTKGYIGTGYGGTYKQDFWEWDQTSNVWNQKTNFGGTGRWRAVGFSIGTKGYIGAGSDANVLKQDFWEYDQVSNIWTQKANFTGIERLDAVGFSIGTKGYIGTGQGINFYQDLWEYNPIVPLICMVTVDSLSQNNTIVWDKATYVNTSIDSFIIYRDTANNNFAPIGSVSYDSLSQFIDTVRTLYSANGDPNASSWRYKISVLDTFGNISVMSPYHQTLFMIINGGTFIWTQYQIEGQNIPVPGLTNYIFQRDNISDGNYSNVISLSASSTLYNDPQYANFPNASYRVMTQWSTQCTATKSSVDYNSSRSNVKGISAPGSINEHSLDNAISIYPNPNDGTFTIKLLSSGFNLPASITIYNVLGEIVYQKPLTTYNTPIILKQPAGIYNVQLCSEKGNINKIIIIE